MAKSEEFSSRHSETTETQEKDTDNSNQGKSALFDPKEFKNAETDPRQSNDVILAAYQDTSISPPENNDRVMARGKELWETTWGNLATGGHENDHAALVHAIQSQQEEGYMRAMNFATSLSEPYQNKLIEAVGYRPATSPEGLRQKELFETQFEAALEKHQNSGTNRPDLSDSDRSSMREGFTAMEEDGRIIREGQKLISSFIERHPEDWLERFNTISNYCKTQLDFGKHVTMMGIVEHDEAMIESGRTAMRDASQTIFNAQGNPGLDDEIISRYGLNETNDQWPGNQADSQQVAESRIIKAQGLKENFANYYSSEEEALLFAAQAIVHQDGKDICRENAALLDGISDIGNISHQMRAVSEKFFGDIENGVMAEAVHALSDQDTERTQATYQKIQEIQQTLLAVAYGEAQNPREVATSANSTEEFLRSQFYGGYDDQIENAVSTLNHNTGTGSNTYDVLRNEMHMLMQAHLDRAAEEVRRDGNLEGPHNAGHSIRQAAQLNACLEPGFLEETAAKAFNAPEWESTISDQSWHSK